MKMLLNQNIGIEREVHETFDTIKLINTTNNMELARIDVQYADELDIWVNPGGFMHKEDYDNYMKDEHIYSVCQDITAEG